MKREPEKPPVPREIVYCDCGEAAVARIESKILCPKCYARSTIRGRKQIDNQVCNEIRAAYAMARGQIVDREPGEDDEERRAA